MAEDKPIVISFTAGTVVKTVVILAIAALLFAIRDIVLIVLTAIVIASAVEPPVKMLVRLKIPRILAVLLVYAILLAVVAVLFYFLIPLVIGDLAGFLTSVPQYLQTLTSSVASQYGGLIGLGSHPNVSVSDILNALKLQDIFSSPLSAVASVFGGAFSFLLIIVFSFYFTVIDSGVDDFLRLITPHSHQAYILGLWRRSQHKIGQWMQGQVLLGALMGVLIYLLLSIFQVPHAPVLAVVTACFELIPVFGIIFAGALAVSVAFAAGGITLAVITLLVFTIAQIFESNLIYPMVVTWIVGMPPLLVILAMIIGGQLWGFLGIILAVPIAATLRELARDYEAGRLPKQE